MNLYLLTQAGPHAGQVLADVGLVWANCRAFNEPESDICAMAEEAEQAFKAKWQQQDLPDQAAAPGKQKDQGKSAKGKQEAAAAVIDKANTKKQKNGESVKAATAGDQSLKEKSSRGSGSYRQSRRDTVAASTDSGRDPQPSSAAAATGRSPSKGMPQHYAPIGTQFLLSSSCSIMLALLPRLSPVTCLIFALPPQ